MNPRALVVDEGFEPLGRCTVAVGVFDGVHRGHQRLLAETVRDAARRGARAVALTFDRDPDQVVTPQSAAPQLLSLEDKVEAIVAQGISRVLVVPFTQQVAAMDAEEFLNDVLASACDVVAIHVGRDFRFGRGAAGDLDTLYVWGVEHNVDVTEHDLVEAHESPVSSTRIRGLIGVGDVLGAAELLGYSPRLTGRVVRGRGEGASLGFATANVRPVEFSALPASGVYAGVAQLEDGARWPAAISVGVPPTFPAAHDDLEAHLIGFEGDLYGAPITLEFWNRIREQRVFESTDGLRAQIADDIEATRVVVCDEGGGPCRAAPAADPFDEEVGMLADDGVEDPEALAAAERAVALIDADRIYADFDETWVEVLGPVSLANVTGPITAFEIVSPLQARDIPYVWQPFSPEALSAVRPELSNVRRFRLYVPREHAVTARQALQVAWPKPGQ